MMLSKTVRHSLHFAVTFAFVSAFLTACVSVNVGPKGPTKAKDVSFKAPSPPYKQVKGLNADGAWQNPDTGNSIGFLSTCNEQSDPSLQSATDDLVSAFGEAKQLSQKKFEFDGREALDTEAESRVEGVPTKIRALVFKKNGCLYALSLIGVSQQFDKGKSSFEEFANGFQAP